MSRSNIKASRQVQPAYRQRKRLPKRRQAIEPIIGHMKSDNRMNRCHLKGAQGDALHTVLCAWGYNIRWFLRMIRIKGIAFYFAFIRLLGLRRLLPKTLRQVVP